MYEVIVFNNGRLGRIWHRETFDEAVSKAVEVLKEEAGEHNVDVIEAISDFNESAESSSESITVFIGQAEQP